MNDDDEREFCTEWTTIIVKIIMNLNYRIANCDFWCKENDIVNFYSIEYINNSITKLFIDSYWCSVFLVERSDIDHSRCSVGLLTKRH